MNVVLACSLARSLLSAIVVLALTGVAVDGYGAQRGSAAGAGVEGVEPPGSMPSGRASRHALVVGVGEYSAPDITPLPGIDVDMHSARKMAHAMGVPDDNIRYLRDKEATFDRIRQEIEALNRRTAAGDRVFLYFSGHGTRWYDATIRKDDCVEAFMPADGKPITNMMMTSMLKPVFDKADKVFMFYDACHSGGMATPAPSRSGSRPLDALVPKFAKSNAPQSCFQPSNMKSRSFAEVAAKAGAHPQNFVQVSSSRPDELSFTNPVTGGLATQFWTECMLADAKDANGSGGISMDEIAACTQRKIDHNLARYPEFLGQHLTLGGNKKLLPSLLQPHAPTAPDLAVDATPLPAPPASEQASAALEGNPTPEHRVTPRGTFDEILAQSDPRRRVNISAPKKELRIGVDLLSLSINSSHDGYVYVLMLGSDQRSFYLIFPNELDQNNHISKEQALRLPRKDWEIVAQGPAGTDTLLVLVTPTPRDLSVLRDRKAGPFLHSVTDADGRTALQWLAGTGAHDAGGKCMGGTFCSDTFGAALLEIDER